MNERATALIERLQLQPHPEGGFYREVYRSGQQVREGDRQRAAVTTIYFLLPAGQFSAWHVVASDEIWHFYEGSPLELFRFDPTSRRLQRLQLGPVETGSVRPCAVIPGGCWQAARPVGEFTLVGCTVAPGFEFTDFALVRDLPQREGSLASLPEDLRSLL